MTTLDEARQEINGIDQEMAALFERRMKAVSSIIAYKLAHNIPIFDSAREAQVIERNCHLLQDEGLKEYFKEFLIFQMDLSKRYQQKLLEQKQK